MQHVRDLGGHLFSLEEFAEMVECNAFTDYDGYGYAVINGHEIDVSRCIHPSTFFETNLEKATEILWFNK